VLRQRADDCTPGDSIIIHCASRDPVEIAGGVIADRERGVMRWLPSEIVAAARIMPLGVIVDDISAGTAAQRAAALQWSDGTLGLHPGTRVIATANPPAIAAGAAEGLTAPELARWRHITMGPEAAVRWLAGQAGDVGLVGRYLVSNPAAALASTEAIMVAVDKQEPYPCPRAWQRAAEEAAIDGSEAGMQCVGTMAWAAFESWRMAQDLPDPREILAGRDSRVPKFADGALATAAALATIVVGPPPVADAALKCACDWFVAAANAGHAGVVSLELGRILKKHDRLAAWVQTGAGSVYARVLS
jgi:hypothetical protein